MPLSELIHRSLDATHDLASDPRDIETYKREILEGDVDFYPSDSMGRDHG